jgi:hypothetical protein
MNLKMTVLAVAFLALVGLCNSAQAQQFPSYELGPFIARGFDDDRGVAEQEARDVIEDHINEIDPILPQEDEIVGVTTNVFWNGFVFEYEYWIHVIILP